MCKRRKTSSISKYIKGLGQNNTGDQGEKDIAWFIQHKRFKEAEPLIAKRTHPADRPDNWDFLDLRGGEHSGVAFVFDIDGVLLNKRGKLIGAPETIRFLHRSKIPYIFLTNRVGASESHLAEMLSNKLLARVDPRQVVIAHTPFKDLAYKYRAENVLMIGGLIEHARDLAKLYGFNNIFTPADIYAACPHWYPRGDQTGADPQKVRFCRRNMLQIDAILVWNSSYVGIPDIPLIIDLLISDEGKLFRFSKYLASRKWQQVPLYICNSDLVYKGSSSGNGAAFDNSFCSTLETLWNHKTRGMTPLQYTLFGKPSKETFAFGEKTLYGWNEILSYEKVFHDLHAYPGPRISPAPKYAIPIKTVYMIGDNVDADIKGAMGYKSRFGYQWKSVLVETGKYQPGTIPEVWPTNITYGVMDAVEWALQQEGWTRFIPRDAQEIREEMEREKAEMQNTDLSEHSKNVAGNPMTVDEWV
ncbi:HAD-like domain-containing protein [Xylogone sp. PMI_703]|nr:HAD-like domain-containing protein [Xylogone sp. PMI_703]